MTSVLRFLFFAALVKPAIFLLLGLNIRRWDLLPATGPAIIVANHNSHLDTLVLMSMLPLRALGSTRPAAAADYFLRNKLLSWFATRIIGIIPVARTGAAGNPLAGCFDALREGNILILYPEGTRGSPDGEMAGFKKGIRILAAKFPEVPVHPVFMRGLGSALPKGEGLFVPFFCDAFVGDAVSFASVDEDFLEALRRRMEALSVEAQPPRWDDDEA